MFRIRKIHDATTPANREVIAQVEQILREQFPLVEEGDITNLGEQLEDPIAYRFRTVLFVAEDAHGHLLGLALFLHVTDLNFGYLEFISAAPGQTGGGLGGALYERVREEARALNVIGLFFECLPDEPHLVDQPDLLPQNIARLRFYENYNARPVMTTELTKPLGDPEKSLLFFLVFDDLGQYSVLRRETMCGVARAILERKYGDTCSPAYIAAVMETYADDPVQLRPARYTRGKTFPKAKINLESRSIPLIVNDRHDIHHVRERGYVEAPVRIGVILNEIGKTGLFQRRDARRFAEKYVRTVHDGDFVDYLRRACAHLPPGKSIYPVVFPIRNKTRPPRDMDMRAGYYCSDTFTPFNRNAYLAARRAVDCAMTGAELLLEGHHFAYALVRPPGHHAERRAVGGFCYFNSAAVAAHHLSAYGRVAVLDIDFHHGNGTQDIFYTRSDVLTISIHGHPNFAFPYFSGFEDETGEGEGVGYNVNLPLPESVTVERYQKTLRAALARIVEFRPVSIVLSLGLDTAKADPTGTWSLRAEDFQRNGTLIGAINIPTLVVQEGGYNTRNLGTNARHFFSGLWEGRRVAKS